MLQNLLCLWKKKTHIFFFVFHLDIDQGTHKGKMKVAQNEKRKKLRGFSFSINIANFEAFLSVFKLTTNLFFLKSERVLGQSTPKKGDNVRSVTNLTLVVP